MPVILRVCVAVELDRPLTYTTNSVNDGASRSASVEPVASTIVAPSLPAHRGFILGSEYHTYASQDPLLPTPKKSEGPVETDARTLNCNGKRRNSAAAVRELSPPSTIATSAMCIGEEPHLSAAATQKQHLSSPPTSFPKSALCQPHLQRQSAPLTRRHRSLLWLSIEVSRRTTVGGVIQKIEDVVVRHVRARVFHGVYHDPNTDGALVIGNTKSCNGVHLSGPVYCDGPNSTALMTLRLSPRKDDVQDDELCFCLQDQNGEYRWIGGTHHFHKVAVAQVPFLAEVCLRSNALFEQRQREQQCVSGQHPTASHPLFPNTSTLVSSHLGSSPHSATEGPCHVGNLDVHGDGLSSEKNSEIPCAVPAGTSGRECFSPVSRVVEDDAWRGAQARRVLSAPKNASLPKLALLKGIVVPMGVLRQHNARYARTRQHHPHGRTPRQYAKVQVPVDMQVETTDGFLWRCETTAATAPAQLHKTGVHTYASTNAESLSPSPADVAATGSVDDTTAQSPIATSSVNIPDTLSRHDNVPLSTVPVYVPSTSADNVDTNTSGYQALNREQPPRRTSTVSIAPPISTALGVSSLSPHATTTKKTSEISYSVDVVHTSSLQGMSNVKACETSIKKEDAALRALERAQYDYVTALTKYRTSATYPPTDLTGIHHSDEKPLLSVIHGEEELVFLMQRKMDLQGHIETCSKAARQCERLITRAEYLERELQEHQRRCELLTQLCHRSSNAA